MINIKNKESLQYVMKLFTAFSCEIRSGNICLSNIRGRSSHQSRFILAEISNEEISPETLRFKEIIEKYSLIGIDLTDSTLSDDSIENSLIRGLFKSSDFESCLSNSYLYKSAEDIPAWRKMLEMDVLDDTATEEVKNALITQFEKRLVKVPGEMLHLFSLIMLISSICEIDKNLDQVKNECFNYINDLYNNGDLPSMKINFLDQHRLGSSYDGQGYWVADGNKSIFFEIFNHLMESVERKFIEDIEKNSQCLLSTMINDTDVFIGKICHQQNGEGSLAEVPILKSIPVETFFESFLKVPRKKWYYISSALKRRYNNHCFDQYLKSEINWAINLVDHFESEAKKLTGFKKYRLERVIPYEIKKVALEIKQQN